MYEMEERAFRAIRLFFTLQKKQGRSVGVELHFHFLTCRADVFLLPQVAHVLRRLHLEAGKGNMNGLAFIALIEKADGGTAFPQRFDPDFTVILGQDFFRRAVKCLVDGDHFPVAQNAPGEIVQMFQIA